MTVEAGASSHLRQSCPPELFYHTNYKQQIWFPLINTTYVTNKSVVYKQLLKAAAGLSHLVSDQQLKRTFKRLQYFPDHNSTGVSIQVDRSIVWAIK